MIKVAPSILSADFANLAQEIRSMTENGADYVHVDIMDGEFVPNISIGIPVVAAVAKVSKIPLDVHLMIDRPLRYTEAFCKAGADILTFHVESDTPENIRKALELTKELGVRPAVSVKPGTPAEAVLPYLDLCSMVLVMTVEPGFGGQKFMEHMMPKLHTIAGYIKERNLDCELEVDGGVGAETFQTCVENGANVLVAGSAYFKSTDPKAFVELLHKGI